MKKPLKSSPDHQMLQRRGAVSARPEDETAHAPMSPGQRSRERARRPFRAGPALYRGGTDAPLATSPKKGEE